ncbi:MAG: 4Fe-4S binding protein [Candidatus Bathyarchaeia archaeon]
MSELELSVELAGVKLKSPLILAAGGPYTKDGETMAKVAKYGMGAITTKTICFEAAEVARPCMVRIQGGLLNCEEWSELDYKAWIEKEIKRARAGGVPIIASIASLKDDVNEVSTIARGVTEAGADMIEVTAGYISENLPRLVSAAKKAAGGIPILAKLCLDHYDISGIGKSLEKAGADGISAIDTIGPCYKIDIETGKLVMGRASGVGRISGPAIKPTAIYVVATLARAVKIPIVGMGGVSNGDDAIEMMMAGAKAVGVCTAALLSGLQVFNKINGEIIDYMKRKGYDSLKPIVGLALKDIEIREKEQRAVYEARPPIIKAERCIGCMACERVCGYYAIKVSNKKPMVNPTLCYGCGLCISVCPTDALLSPYLK